MRSVLRILGVALAACLCAAVFGCGVPLVWLWVASRLQASSGQGIGMGTAALVLLGPPATFAGLIWLANRLTAPSGPGRPQRMAWNRSRDEARNAPKATTLEQVCILTTLIVAGAFEIWFLFFAHQIPWGGNGPA